MVVGHRFVDARLYVILCVQMAMNLIIQEVRISFKKWYLYKRLLSNIVHLGDGFKKKLLSPLFGEDC